MYKIFLSALVVCSLFSCQQAYLEFSCDPVINDFVLGNIDELSQLSVTEVTSYDLSLQKAIFNSWDYQKKRNAWLDKLNDVMNRFEFSKVEIEHIQKLIDHIDIDYFLDDIPISVIEDRVVFAEEWINYATNELQWADQFVAFLVYRLYTDQSQFDLEFNEMKSLKIGMTSNSEIGGCNCNVSSDFCSGSFCTSNGCSTGSGCGWLWSETCNGLC